MSPTDKRTAENERMLIQALEVLNNRDAHPEDRRAARHLVSILARDGGDDDSGAGLARP